MGRSTLRRVLAACGLAVVALVLAPVSAIGAVGGSVAEASSSDAASLASDPVSRLGACLAGGGQGDLLLLIDESGSLKSTDPTNSRIASAAYLVNQLTTYVASSGAKLAIKVGGFSSNYVSIGGWTVVSAAGKSGIIQNIDSLADKNTGFETDYWSALQGARSDLASRQTARGETVSCQAIAWFTDGRLDYSPRTTGALISQYGDSKPFNPGLKLTSAAANREEITAARNDICRPGGVADQLRSSGVIVFAIGLHSSESSANDFSLLNSVATGSDSASGATCGGIITPIPGKFYLASDISDLLFAFDLLSTPGESPLQQQSGICQAGLCDNAGHDFVLDDSTPVVHVLGSADIPTVDVDLISPAGTIVPLPNSAVGSALTANLAGATISYSWQSANTVEIDLSKAGGSTAWAGQWKLVFIDPTGTSTGKTSRSNIHISSDFVPAWSGNKSASLHAGDSVGNVTFGIADKSGAPVPAQSILGSISFKAVITDAAGHQLVLANDLGKSQLSKAVSTELTGVTTGAATLSLQLTVTTAPTRVNGNAVPGTTLAPSSVQFPVTILPPDAFPVVANSVNFGLITGATQAHAMLHVTGKGCAWLPTGSAMILASPQGAGKVTVTSASANSGSCVKGGKSLPVTLTMQHEDTGTINGTLHVRIADSADLGHALNTSVSFTADVLKPLNESNFLLSLIVALLLGPGIPIGLLYLAKWWGARIPARALLFQRIPVTVVDGQVQRDGAPFALRPTDLTELAAIHRGGARSVSLAGVTLDATVGGSPIGAGYVRATATGFISASDVIPGYTSRSWRARLPLAVHNHWVVLHAVGASATQAEVLVLVSGDASMERKDALVDDLRSRLPDLLSLLLAEASERQSEPTDAAAGSFGGPAGTPVASGFGFDSPAGGAAPESSGSGFGGANDGFGFGFGFDSPNDRSGF